MAFVHSPEGDSICRFSSVVSDTARPAVLTVVVEGHLHHRRHWPMGETIVKGNPITDRIVRWVRQSFRKILGYSWVL